ncbi:MAG: YidC/Oxa1 family membrane protein insertase [Patescibacteria group bacterium]
MISFLKTVIYEPLYNTLIAIIGVSPWIDAGIAVVILTIAVRLVIYPLSKKAIITQRKMQVHQDELKEIREKYKEDKQKQAEKMLEFYKEKEINPFSTVLLLLVQMPVIISLYLIFIHANLPELRPDLLYSFTPTPDNISMTFFNVFDISEKSVVLALFAGITSFIQLKLSLPAPKERKKDPSFKDELARNMNMQMRYVFPFIITGIAYTLSAVVALYLLTTNLFTIFQELSLRKDKERFDQEAKEKAEKKEKDKEANEKDKEEKESKKSEAIENKGEKESKKKKYKSNKKKNGRRKGK